MHPHTLKMKIDGDCVHCTYTPKVLIQCQVEECTESIRFVFDFDEFLRIDKSPKSGKKYAMTINFVYDFVE